MSRLPFGVRLLLGAAAVFAAAVTEAAPAVKRLDGTEVAPTVLTTRIQELARRGNVHGLGVTVFNAGEPVYSRTFGFKRTDTKEPLTSDTVFYGASVSKAVFGVLVMHLVDDGVIDLDTPLVKYLKEPLDAFEARSPKAWHENLKDLAADPRHTKLTARMCLAHTTGLPNWRWFEPEQKLRIKTEPGARYSYSGEGLTVLQVVLERLTRKSIEELAKEKIFVPYGMTRSSYTWQPRFESDYCHGHDEAGKVQEKDKDNAARSASTLEQASRLCNDDERGGADGHRGARADARGGRGCAPADRTG